MGERLRDFIFRLKIFGWYLITEPFRQLIALWHLFLNLLDALNKTRTWIYVAIVFMIVSLLLGKRFAFALFAAFLLLCVLLLEWESGRFMFRYREKVRKRIEEGLKKEEVEKK